MVTIDWRRELTSTYMGRHVVQVVIDAITSGQRPLVIAAVGAAATSMTTPTTVSTTTTTAVTTIPSAKYSPKKKQTYLNMHDIRDIGLTFLCSWTVYWTLTSLVIMIRFVSY